MRRFVVRVMSVERFTPLKFQRKTLDSQGMFEGYASTFGGDPDAYGDIIASGAFAESLAEHKANDTKPALLWSHNPSEPIGVFTEIREDEKGLAVTGRLSLGGERARAAYSLMQDDALALSIGFRTRNADYDNDGVRILRNIDLVEVSAVAIPANRNARITTVKTINDIREFENELKSHFGFSSRQARKLASGGWPAFAKQEDDVEERELLKAIAGLFRNSAEEWSKREEYETDSTGWY